MSIGTSMAARQGPVAMAAHQICYQVWLAVALLTDALAASSQVISFSFFFKFNKEWGFLVSLFIPSPHVNIELSFHPSAVRQTFKPSQRPLNVFRGRLDAYVVCMCFVYWSFDHPYMYN